VPKAAKAAQRCKKPITEVLRGCCADKERGHIAATPSMAAKISAASLDYLIWDDRMRISEISCGHVLDHALTQRADGGIGTHGELLLSEVACDLDLSSGRGSPPHYGLLSNGDPTLDRAPRAAAIAAAI
jgi:hypothetical protein